MVHCLELQKMGAQIKFDISRAQITGVSELYGAHVIASDIRASAALVLAGLAAHGLTTISGVHHFRRGYDQLDAKLRALGASVNIIQADHVNLAISKKSLLDNI